MIEVDDDIREIAVSIWETLFSVALERGAEGERAADPVVTGCVHIDGAWHGAVMLHCGVELAGLLAGELFRTPTPTPDEVRDTIGELTNMLAGNIKALLPEPSRISLPAVAFGADYDLRVMGTTTVAAVPFRCSDSTVVVTLLQRREDDA